MYTMINEKIELILSSISKEEHVEPYIYLTMKPRIEGTEIIRSEEYRKKYRHYWRMNAARLPVEFFKEYFKILSDSYRDKFLASDIAEKLFSIKDDKESYQFSFATKLVHMSDTSLPIYDSMISSFYYMPKINQNRLSEKKVWSEANYNFLKSEYERILSLGLLEHSINSFRTYFEVDEEFSDHKIIDSLLWAFVSFSQRGAIIERKLSYS
ncbi:hypothetical protein J7I00_004551 [Vibrio parahaemolyticus]|nr:hypothetical protein [Vibrio parahaemolyticus]